jgi:hypothetical protein
METGGAQGNENCETAEIVLVFCEAEAYSTELWQE